MRDGSEAPNAKEGLIQALSSVFPPVVIRHNNVTIRVVIRFAFDFEEIICDFDSVTDSYAKECQLSLHHPFFTRHAIHHHVIFMVVITSTLIASLGWWSARSDRTAFAAANTAFIRTAVINTAAVIRLRNGFNGYNRLNGLGLRNNNRLAAGVVRHEIAEISHLPYLFYFIYDYLICAK